MFRRTHKSSQKIPSKSETKALREALTAGSYEQFSPPDSPLIDRRPISPSTEAALRAACNALVDGGSTQIIPTEFLPKVVDSTRASEDLVRAVATGSSSHATGKHSRKDSRQNNDAVPHPTKYSYKPDAAIDELCPVNSNERRAMQAHQQFPKRRGSLPVNANSDEGLPQKPSIARMDSMPEAKTTELDVASLMDPPKTAPFSDSSNASTPLSASTDRFPNHAASTAMTTAAVTPSRPSHKASQNFVLNDDDYQAAAEQADAAAIEWMKKELDKRRQKQDRDAQAAHWQPQAPQRPASRSSGRGRSLSNGIMEYIRPRTASNSRPGSRGGPQQSDASGLQRSPSQSHGWKSWGLQRKTSKSKVKDAPADLARSQSDTKLVGKPEIDLNRPLPALPSLDTYQEPESKSSTGMHIANLMRPKHKDINEAAKEAQARVINIQRVKAVPQSLPRLQTEPSTIPLSPPIPRCDSTADGSSSNNSQKVTNTHSKSSSQDSCFSPGSSSGAFTGARSVDVVKAAERVRKKSQENLRGRSRKDSSTSSTQTPPPVPHKVSFSANRPATSTTAASRPVTQGGPVAADGSACVNFSRKISTEQHVRPFYDPRHPNAVGITALPPMPPPPRQKKSLAGLRKIVSQWTLSTATVGQKNKKGADIGWIEYLEKDANGMGGTGYMVPGVGGAEAPVVRY
jgi:hypothetical protein